MARYIAKLIGNGIHHRRLRLSGKACRLESLSLEITHRCICRCSMCNIWQIPPEVPDLDLSVWQELLCSPELHHLRELDLTGGEPFLRHDAGKLLQAICEAQPAHFPRLRTLAITTNGILTDRILGHVRPLVAHLQKRGIDLVLSCGVDAVGNLHDRIRNYPGAWDKLQETFAGLYRIRESHPNLILGIKTTIIPLNIRELIPIAAYARSNNLFTIISPRIVTPNRFRNSNNEESLRFTTEDLQEMIHDPSSRGPVTGRRSWAIFAPARSASPAQPGSTPSSFDTTARFSPVRSCRLHWETFRTPPWEN